jgi:hypothetical protein
MIIIAACACCDAVIMAAGCYWGEPETKEQTPGQKWRRQEKVT